MKASVLTTILCLCLSLRAGAQTTFPRCVVVEEFTGTHCGWCPRGLAGMMKLRQTFGDRCIGVAVHNYDTNDPMYYRPYAYAGVFSDGPGAPTCMIDRISFCDPLHGASGNICDDVSYVLQQPCYVGLELSGSYNADSTVVDAQATITAGTDLGQMTIVYVLVADSVYSADQSFMQYNSYAASPADRYPNDPEVHRFCQGGTEGTSPFRWAFDDVCIGSSYNGAGQNQADAVPPLAQGEQAVNTLRLTMPTKAVLRRTVKKRLVSLVAMLIGEDGQVVNAAKTALVPTSDAQGVETMSIEQGTMNKEVYDLQGRPASTRSSVIISKGHKRLVP